VPTAEAASATVAVASPTSAPTSTPEAEAPVTATAPPATAEPTLEPSLEPTTVASAEAATPVAAGDDVPLLDENHPAPTAAPAPAGATVAASDPVRIVIKAIAMDRSLVSVGLDAKRQPIVPKHDAAWYNLSARPGQGENVVLWGHVLRFKSTPKIAAPFARLKELKPGAAITLYTADGTAHPYRVDRQVWATPDQVEFILPSGAEQLTLVSCIGDKVILDGALEMTNRLVTIAVPAE
jgi:hypothetical protein